MKNKRMNVNEVQLWHKVLCSVCSGKLVNVSSLVAMVVKAEEHRVKKIGMMTLAKVVVAVMMVEAIPVAMKMRVNEE